MQDVRNVPGRGYTYVKLLDRPMTDTTFDQLFVKHHDAIRRYCRRRLGAIAAEDAAADVFVVAWRRIADVPPGDEALLWLYGVARNTVARSQRSMRRQGRLAAKVLSLGSDSPDPPETLVLRSAEEQELLDALWTLRPADREVLRLKAWEGLTHAEIASVLGISVSAVDARASRALKRLSRLVSTGGPI
jgi:RNA polymerase sigma-70 factor (ECF subfamily)